MNKCVNAAEVAASWDALFMTQHCFLSAEGECVDETCAQRARSKASNCYSSAFTPRPPLN